MRVQHQVSRCMPILLSVALAVAAHVCILKPILSGGGIEFPIRVLRQPAGAGGVASGTDGDPEHAPTTGDAVSPSTAAAQAMGCPDCTQAVFATVDGHIPRVWSVAGAEHLALHERNTTRTVVAMSKEISIDPPDIHVIPTFKKGCRSRHQWQNDSYPICNNMHAIDMLPGYEGRGIEFVGKGARRIAWKVFDPAGVQLALKTVIKKVSCGEARQYLTKREVQALDRLSASSHATGIYGHCGCSAFHEFLVDGQLGAHYFKTLDKSIDKLRAAYEVAEAISDVHGTEDDGIPSIVYGHLQSKNLMFDNGRCKLTDFEQADFLKWNGNEKDPRICGFHRDTGSGRRAPEEGPSKYPYKYITDKSDVYRLGNIFHKLLTDSSPPLDHCDVKESIIRTSPKGRDPEYDTLLGAFQMANACNPEERENSKSITEFLKEGIETWEKHHAGNSLNQQI